MTGLVLAALLALDPKAQLELLKERQAAEAKAAAELSKKEVSVLDALNAADEALSKAEGEARAAEAARAAAQKRLEAAARAQDDAQARLGALVAQLGPRMAARYRMGRWGELRLLASAGSMGELVKRRYLVDRILGEDVATLKAAQAALAEREAARGVREADAADLAKLAEAATERADEAAQAKEARVRLLGAVRGQKALHEKAAHEAGEQQVKLAEFISALPPRTAGEGFTGFGLLRGKLPRPADGPIEVGYGKVVNPRFNTVTIQNGVDIRAPRGAPVRAVAPGRVVHAGWFKGYGNLVIIDHGDGYHTLVAHLDTMSTAMGETVEPGSLLGTVGDTGSLKGPFLYFEIREKGRPVDPALWLRP